MITQRKYRKNLETVNEVFFHHPRSIDSCRNMCTYTLLAIKMMFDRWMQLLFFLVILVDHSLKNDSLLEGYSWQGMKHQIGSFPISTDIQSETTEDSSSNNKDISNRILSISHIIIFLMPLLLVQLL